LTLSILPIVHFSVSETVTAIFLVDMRSKHEFNFALAERIHRIVISPKASDKLQTLHRLNEAHLTFKFDPFLTWRRRFARPLVG
jgi:hypothetical protein